MTIWTTTANGANSTADLDAMFAALQAMPTKDIYGRRDSLLTAKMYEEMYNCWHFRDLSFGDGSGMKALAKRKAAEWYRKHAEEIENW